MTGFPKTSGATGLQIYVPLEQGAYTYAEARAFVGACGRLIKEADPDKVTMAWRVADRSGKIFIDHNMNRQGANIAAAYSLRPEPRAPVSTPLTWDEVRAGGFEPQDFRIDNVWERFAKVGDLWTGVRDGPGADLAAALGALGVEVEEDDPVRGPLPRTAAPSVETKTSDEIALASKDPALFEYVRRRAFGPEGTTEPAPGDEAGAGNSFVIHKHRATRLHYDVRLERDGGLPSWAVPKGLPITKGEKRLAVQTEVHPLEYGSFQGTIPEGHYGAGEVRIFDDGWYEPIEWTDTKVSFRLHGRRYPGLEFHFVKTRTDWLAFLASNQTAPLIPSPPRFTPMLAEGGGHPFDDPAWWFEPKLDGIRCLAEMTTGDTVLRSRTGRDMTAQYPELHMVHELVDEVNAVIDGEIVAFDASGRNSFETLQQRMNLANPRQIERMRAQIPVALVVFDLLWLDGRDTTGLTLEDRRELLRLVVEQDDRLQLVTWVEGEGTALVRCRANPRARGRRGQAPRLPLPPGPTDGRVAQDQAPRHAGLRDPRVHAGRTWSERHLRRGAGRRRTTAARSGGSGKPGAASRTRCSRASSSSSGRSCGRARRSTTPSSRASRAPCSSSRRSSARSSTPRSRRARRRCAPRSSSGSGRTSSRKTACSSR